MKNKSSQCPVWLNMTCADLNDELRCFCLRRHYTKYKFKYEKEMFGLVYMTIFWIYLFTFPFYIIPCPKVDKSVKKKRKRNKYEQ